MNHKTLLGLAACALALASFRAEASPESDRAALIERGKKDFLIYCSNCHGQDGKGKGPMAGLLNIPAADLTRLHTGGGEFPFKRVHDSIAGGGTMKGHGGGEMPVWGDAFGATKSVRINELIHFLETIQAK